MLEYDRQKLGEHLKSARMAAEFTQAEVSKKLGYTSAQFISNIERGVSVAPLKTLSKMLNLYKSNPDKMSRILLAGQEQLLLQKLVYVSKAKRKH